MTTIAHIITLDSPMSHGDPGAESGNVTRFRRIPILIDGAPVPVPAISAGALRGVIRRLLWRETFDLVGLSRETCHAGSWDRLYAALANGGHIEKAEKRIVPDTIRARRAALPVLSLLGAALYDSHMSGRALVSNSWLMCAEVDGDGAPKLRDLMADESRVRHVDAEEQDPDVSGVTPMPTTIETVIAGASFSGRATIAPSLEASAWAHGLDLVTHLGGKSGQGFGEVTITHNGDGSEYVSWLQEHAADLRASLDGLASSLGAGKRKSKSKPKKPTPAPNEEVLDRVF